MAADGSLKWGNHRAPKSASIPQAAWAEHRLQIEGLYRTETLETLMQIMRETYSFRPSKRQYTLQLSKWGAKKYGFSRSESLDAASKGASPACPPTSVAFGATATRGHSAEPELLLNAMARRGAEQPEHFMDVLWKCLPALPDDWTWASELICTISWVLPVGSLEAIAWLTFEDTRRTMELAVWLVAHDMWIEALELDLLVLCWYEANIPLRTAEDYLSIILCSHGAVACLSASPSLKQLKAFEQILAAILTSTQRSLNLFEKLHLRKLFSLVDLKTHDRNLEKILIGRRRRHDWLDDWLLEDQVELQHPDLLVLYCSSQDFGGPDGAICQLLRDNAWFLRNLNTYWSTCIESCAGRYDLALRQIIVHAAEIPAASYTSVSAATNDLLQIFARLAPECSFAALDGEQGVSPEAASVLKWYCEEIITECLASGSAYSARCAVTRWQAIIASSQSLMESSTGELGQRFVFKHFIAPEVETGASAIDVCDPCDVSSDPDEKAQEVTAPIPAHLHGDKAGILAPLATSLDSQSIASLRSIYDRVCGRRARDSRVTDAEIRPSKMLRRSASFASTASSAMSGLNAAQFKLSAHCRVSIMLSP